MSAEPILEVTDLKKVYHIPELRRESRGRAIVNLLNLEEGEKITDCRAVRDFNLPDHFLMMATRQGLVKKTPLEAYSRPKKGGIIAIKLREDDELVDVVVTKPGDELVLATANGMAIRFAESDAALGGLLLHITPMVEHGSELVAVDFDPPSLDER